MPKKKMVIIRNCGYTRPEAQTKVRNLRRRGVKASVGRMASPHGLGSSYCIVRKRMR
jgi:hypothetical protein